MRSIQRNLILWLAAALAAGLVVVMAVSYAFAYAQITRVFDEELVHIAEAVHMGEDWRGPARIRIPRPGFNLSVRAYDGGGNTYFETAQPSMPDDLPKAFEAGHSVVRTGAGPWRVYAHATPEGFVQVGQPDATRTALARQLSLRMALPELALIPFLVLFIAWVFQRGLAPLRQISRRVQDRDATRLDPLPLEDVPAELLPLIVQINALLARLSASLAGQRRFVADAAHELRTPIAALALQVQVAERAAQPASRTAAFAELHLGVTRATRVVEQLLNLARLDPDGSREAFQPVDLAGIVAEVVGSMAHRARTLGVDLGADADDEAPMAGVKSELRSMISNLVDNALRYAPRGSEVTVMVRRDATRIHMAVVDAGPGIAAQERETVFERFHRAEGDDTPGIGLGLAIVRTIVARHGGSVTLEDARTGLDAPGLAVRVEFPASATADRAGLFDADQAPEEAPQASSADAATR